MALGGEGWSERIAAVEGAVRGVLKKQEEAAAVEAAALALTAERRAHDASPEPRAKEALRKAAALHGMPSAERRLHDAAAIQSEFLDTMKDRAYDPAIIGKRP